VPARQWFPDAQPRPTSWPLPRGLPSGPVGGVLSAPAEVEAARASSVVRARSLSDQDRQAVATSRMIPLADGAGAVSVVRAPARPPGVLRPGRPSYFPDPYGPPAGPQERRWTSNRLGPNPTSRQTHTRVTAPRLKALVNALNRRTQQGNPRRLPLWPESPTGGGVAAMPGLPCHSTPPVLHSRRPATCVTQTPTHGRPLRPMRLAFRRPKHLYFQTSSASAQPSSASLPARAIPKTTSCRNAGRIEPGPMRRSSRRRASAPVLRRGPYRGPVMRLDPPGHRQRKVRSWRGGPPRSAPAWNRRPSSTAAAGHRLSCANCVVDHQASASSTSAARVGRPLGTGRSDARENRVLNLRPHPLNHHHPRPTIAGLNRSKKNHRTEATASFPSSDTRSSRISWYCNSGLSRMLALVRKRGRRTVRRPARRLAVDFSMAPSCLPGGRWTNLQ